MRILSEHSLELALGAVVAVEAVANTGGVVTEAAARAVAAGLVAIAVEHVGARGAFDERAVRAAPTQIANAPDVLLRVPRRRVDAVSLNSQLLLREADAGITAFVGANCALARNAVVVGKALALAGFPVASALVGALRHGMRIVR